MISSSLKRRTCSYAESGVWLCHRCGEKGNLYQLRERLGLGRRGDGIQSVGQALRVPVKRIPISRVDAFHRALLADPDAMAYCQNARRWSREVIQRFQLGLRADNRGKWLAFPWMRRGECVGMKFRILPAWESQVSDRFDREPGCESTLFNVDALERHEEVILASGESDTLALVTLGFDNVVATTTGEGHLPAAAVDTLAKKQRVFIVFDNDPAGHKGARAVAKRLGLERCWLVTLPDGVKDVNEFLVSGGTREGFDELLAAAGQLDVPSILSVAQALDRLEEEKTIGVWDELDEVTPWPTVNRRVGRWRPGNLITLSGPQGTGKTTLALGVVSHWAADGRPVLLYCLEMTVEELVQHVLCAHYRVAESDVTPELIGRARHDLQDWPLFLGANPSLTGRKDVFDLLAQAVRRYGLRLLAFDNLHMLARSIEHRTEEVGVLTKSFKLFAMEHAIPVVVIAQPRKLEPGRVMTPWDLKDSVDIFSDSDQILLLHREMIGAARGDEALAAAVEKATDNLSPMTLVRVAKGRHQPSRDAVLYFEGEQHRFREVESGDCDKPKSSVRRHPGHADGE